MAGLLERLGDDVVLAGCVEEVGVRARRRRLGIEAGVVDRVGGAVLIGARAIEAETVARTRKISSENRVPDTLGSGAPAIRVTGLPALRKM